MQVPVGGTPLGKFSQKIALEFQGDRVILLESFSEGKEVIVDINLKCRIVEDKYFNTLKVWRISEVNKT